MCFQGVPAVVGSCDKVTIWGNEVSKGRWLEMGARSKGSLPQVVCCRAKDDTANASEQRGEDLELFYLLPWPTVTFSFMALKFSEYTSFTQK